MMEKNQPTSQKDYRKAFGQLASIHTQRVTSLRPVEVIFDIQEDVAGGIHSVDFEKGDIMVKQSGMYLIIAAPQVGKSKGTRSRWIDFWVRVNNVDVPYSNVRRVMGDSQEKDVIPLNMVTPLNRGDTLNIMMSAETENEGIGIEMIEPDGEPSVPSIILTIVQLD